MFIASGWPKSFAGCALLPVYLLYCSITITPAANLRNLKARRTARRSTSLKEFVFHLINTYGYPGLFGILMLGLVGLPVPDEVILGFTGYMAYRGELSLVPSIATAFLGSVCGITLSYAVGRTLGFFLVEKYGHLVHLTSERLQRTRDWFDRFGKWALPLGYFIPGFRHVAAYIAGATKFKLQVFALFAYTGGLLWSCTFILLGYYLGEDWESITMEVRRHLLAAGGVLLVMVVLFLVARQLRKK